jgi:GntR family transcriptional regulator
MALYEDISNDLLAKIKDGTYQEGQRIPSEKDLAQDYGVSRPTVRQALQLLVDDGYLDRRRRRGTVVCHPKVRQHFTEGLMSFSDDMRLAGNSMRTVVIIFRREKAQETVADALHIAPGNEVYKLVRLRYVEDTANVFVETYLPCAELPDIDDVDFSNASLYQTLTECGSAVVSAHRRFEAVSADGALATLLDVAVGDPMLLFYTVDRMSDLGRSIDTDLVNPLTYRPMTGSTSGGAINVLKGINDACVGTDGGGSVLAPAMATNLYAIMAKGVGLYAGRGQSTDGMDFSTGLGFIGKSFDAVRNLLAFSLRSAPMQNLRNLSISLDSQPFDISGLQIFVPASGTAHAPDGADMHMRCMVELEKLGEGIPSVHEIAFDDIYDRGKTVRQLKELWKADPDAIVMDVEGPIDVFGCDETIPRSFSGTAPAAISGRRSKALCKAVNIACGSGCVIPTGALATGILVCSGPGAQQLHNLLNIGKRLDEVQRIDPLMQRYFLDRTKPHIPLRLFREN